MSYFISQALDYILLAFGFGFVIFFHELGHFLAAKYCDVRVDQFAVGFGSAIFSWRKGLGFRWGSSAKEFEDLKKQEVEGVPKTDLSQVSETEYRLNYIPLGGYVKMLGQDDLNPNATASDPRAYNNKTIRARMVIVSAGVVMNVILAALGFMVVFLLGYPAPAAVAGSLMSQSPALKATDVHGNPAPLRPGDAIIQYGDHPTHNDFTKIILNVALSEEGKVVPIVIRRHGTDSVADPNTLPTETIYVTPERLDGSNHGFLALGISQPFELKGLDPKVKLDPDYDKNAKALDEPDALALMPGDVVTQINGKNVQTDEIWKLFDALSQSDGKPVVLTVRSLTGEISHRDVMPHFEAAFNGQNELDILGMIPRATVASIQPKSPAVGKLLPGDVIVSVNDPQLAHSAFPSATDLMKILGNAGDQNRSVSMDVIGLDGKLRTVPDLSPSMQVAKNRKGLGVGLGFDEQHAVVAAVVPHSSVDGKIQRQDTITAFDDQPVQNWFQIRRLIADETPGKPVTLTFTRDGESKPRTETIELTADDIQAAKMMVVAAADVQFNTLNGNRKTSNPVIAIGWGIQETRDLILQFYLTLQRMVTGAVSYQNMMGPVGIFAAGAQFADKGTSWLIWFLAMISANLAVVNFLPIPIVDGGLFTFLILEKIQGRPLSPETQKIVQVVGLALILGVFLLVTYQDFARLAGFQ